MCKCDPTLRTPFCGKPGCEWPTQKEELNKMHDEIVKNGLEEELNKPGAVFIAGQSNNNAKHLFRIDVFLGTDRENDILFCRSECFENNGLNYVGTHKKGVLNKQYGIRTDFLKNMNINAIAEPLIMRAVKQMLEYEYPYEPQDGIVTRELTVEEMDREGFSSVIIEPEGEEVAGDDEYREVIT